MADIGLMRSFIITYASVFGKDSTHKTSFLLHEKRYCNFLKALHHKHSLSFVLALSLSGNWFVTRI